MTDDTGDKVFSAGHAGCFEVITALQLMQTKQAMQATAKMQTRRCYQPYMSKVLWCHSSHETEGPGKYAAHKLL